MPCHGFEDSVHLLCPGYKKIQVTKAKWDSMSKEEQDKKFKDFIDLLIKTEIDR